MTEQEIEQAEQDTIAVFYQAESMRALVRSARAVVPEPSAARLAWWAAASDVADCHEATGVAMLGMAAAARAVLAERRG